MLLRHLLPLLVDACSGVCNAGGRGTDYSRREGVGRAHHGEQKRRTWRGPDVTRLAVTLNARRGQTLHVRGPFSAGALLDPYSRRRGEPPAGAPPASRVPAHHRAPGPRDPLVQGSLAAGAAARRLPGPRVQG